MSKSVVIVRIMTTFHWRLSCTLNAVVETDVAYVIVAGGLLPGHVVAGEYADELSGLFPLREREEKQASSFLSVDVVLSGYG